jgi:hypothetical protein
VGSRSKEIALCRSRRESLTWSERRKSWLGLDIVTSVIVAMEHGRSDNIGVIRNQGLLDRTFLQPDDGEIVDGHEHEQMSSISLVHLFTVESGTTGLWESSQAIANEGGDR